MATLLQQINTANSNVVNGKTAIATAITNKGVTTANNAPFSTMAANINSISQSGGLSVGDKINVRRLQAPQILNAVGNGFTAGYYIKVSDGYLTISVYPLTIKKVSLDGTTVTSMGTISPAVSNQSIYIFKQDIDGGIIMGTSNGYLIKIASDYVTKVFEFNIAHSSIYSVYCDTDGYVVGSSAGYLTKVNSTGTTKVWDCNVAHGYIYDIIKDTDGYILANNSGYITKISLDGTTKIFDTSTSGWCSYNYALYKDTDGFVVAGYSGSLTKYNFDGTKIYNITDANGNANRQIVVKDSTDGCYVAGGDGYISKYNTRINTMTKLGQLSSMTFISITADTDGLVLLTIAGHMVKLGYDGTTIIFDTAVAASTAVGYCVYNDTDGYISAWDNRMVYKTSKDGTTQLASFDLGTTGMNSMIKVSDGYIFMTSMYIIKTNLALTAKLWTYNMATSGGYSLIAESDGYVFCNSSSIIKISLDGQTKMWEKSFGYVTRSIYRDTDGYIVGTTSHIYKVSLDGQTTIKDLNMSGTVVNIIKYDNYFIAIAGSNYYVINSDVTTFYNVQSYPNGMISGVGGMNYVISGDYIYTIHPAGIVCKTIYPVVPLIKWSANVGHGRIGAIIITDLGYLLLNYQDFVTLVGFDGEIIWDAYYYRTTVNIAPYNVSLVYNSVSGKFIIPCCGGSNFITISSNPQYTVIQ